MTAIPAVAVRLRVRSLAYRAIVPLASVGAALAVSAVISVIVGANPLEAYGAMLQGSAGGVGSLATTAVRTTPLLLTGLSVALSFRAGVFNVGAEGQLYAGAALATVVALLPIGLPPLLHVPLTLAAGFVGGALWALVPALLRAYRGVSEVVTTLMLNFVGIQLVSYLVDPITGPLGERGASYAQSPTIPHSAELPILIRGTSLHAGLLIGVALAAGLFVLLKYTPIGFRLRMLGGNPVAARFAGLSSSREIVIVMLLSGGIAGLAGAAEIMGLRHRLYDRFSPGYGYDGIAVALLAASNPLAVLVSATFFGGLRAGANAMQQATGIETSVVLVIQALTILFVIFGPLRSWASRRAAREAEPFPEEGSNAA
jgi:simple sugar transport system permease protein